jgi:GT2 family glycosyltransferase
VDALAAEPEAGDSELILFLDGSKGAADRKEVAAVRALAGEISGFGSIRIHAAEQNLGLARSISEGVSKVCREHGRAIILEDDVVPVAGFLSFMNEALEKYQEEPQVMQVSGYAYPLESAPSTHAFLPLTSCWGWATWKRAWQHYDHELAYWPEWRDASDGLAGWLDDAREVTFWKDVLGRVERGEISSWASIWVVSLWRQQMLTILPCHNLVSNLGFGNSATDGVV